MTNIVTRFAPSPTGNLHLGSARTALLNFIVSEQNSSSKFYIRIEDTDKERSKTEYINNILDGLKWLGIKWEDSIQIQSKRIKRHQEIAYNLLENKHAYKCICSEDKLKKQRELIKNNKLFSKKICTDCKNNENIQNASEGFVVRMKLPDQGEIKIQDIIQGNITVQNKELDDYIILRKDLSPTYMLSVVVDDNDLGVNFVIRGDDHLNNTFRQYYIYKYLDWIIPEYGHIPLIHGEDGSKLSKRHGAVDVLDFKKKGYLKEAIINNLILLGWSPGKNNEIIDLSEIIKIFKISKLSKSSSIFSYKKLNFFNNYYLRNIDGLNKFFEFCNNNEKLKILLLKNKERMERIFEIYKKDLNNFNEFLSVVDVYFNENFKYDKKEIFNQEFINIFNDFKKNISNIEIWEKENIQKIIEDFLNLNKVKFPILGKPIRFILINSYKGPSITDIFVILGKKDSMYRLNQYIEKI